MKKLTISIDELIRMYLDENLSPAQIGAQFGMHENSVRYHLRKAKVIKPSGWQNRKTPTADLVRMYVEEQLSLSEIAKATGMTKAPIRGRLMRAGIDMRSPMARGWADPKRRPLEHPSTVQMAWAAGIYEGEGSVVVPDSPYGLRTPVVSVTQKDRWLCPRLRALFGGTVKQNTKQHGAYDYWRLTGPRAVGFLMTIYTFLSPRRQQQIRDAFAKAGILNGEPALATG